LGINYSIAHRATEVHRIRVPYSPFFVQQVSAGNVKDITSRGTAIQGRFRHAVAATNGGTKSTLFGTEIPSFANTDALSQLLQTHKVVVNAEPLDTGVVWWKSLLF